MGRPKIREDCSVEGCDKPYFGKGFCLMHYARWRKTGSPGPALPYNRKVIFTVKDHPLHEVWRGMVKRCYYEKHPQYKNYGGRGIKVCDRWLGVDGFDNFLEDMGERPEGTYPSGRPYYTLDRIDGDNDYCKENCRWASGVEQGSHKINNRVITYQGQTHIAAEWARILGIRPGTFSERRRRHPDDKMLWFKELGDE